jgi:hypothetical protein
MLKRGYIILLVGAALVTVGIGITAAYGIGIASLILNESIIITDVMLNPSESVNRTLDITSSDRPVSIALHVESNGTDNPVVEQKVINPRGFTISENKIGLDGENDLFTSFKPEIDGIYILSLYNLGHGQAKIAGIFGYLPITENNGAINLTPVTGLLTGVWIFLIGIGVLVGGTVITVIDRRGDKKRQSLGLAL